MESISKECQNLKNEYDMCFNKWFRDSFLKGNTSEDECAPIFKSYQACVKKGIKEKGIELWEIERDVMGTSDEKQPPNKPGNS